MYNMCDISESGGKFWFLTLFFLIFNQILEIEEKHLSPLSNGGKTNISYYI